jgi:hypothetical protein
MQYVCGAGLAREKARHTTEHWVVSLAARRKGRSELVQAFHIDLLPLNVTGALVKHLVLRLAAKLRPLVGGGAPECSTATAER